MRVDDLKALKNFLDRNGALDASNRDLIEDAIFALDDMGNSYRAERDIRALSANLSNSGRRDLAEHCDRLL